MMTDIQRNRLRIAFLSAAAALLLLVALVVGRESGIADQGTTSGGTDSGGTPIPTVVNDLPPLDGKLSVPEFENLDSALNASVCG